MSACSSVCLPVCLAICLSICLAICLSTCLSGHLSVHLSASPSVCPSAWPLICLGEWHMGFLKHSCLPLGGICRVQKSESNRMLFHRVTAWKLWFPRVDNGHNIRPFNKFSVSCFYRALAIVNLVLAVKISVLFVISLLRKIQKRNLLYWRYKYFCHQTRW